MKCRRPWFLRSSVIIVHYNIRERKVHNFPPSMQGSSLTHPGPALLEIFKSFTRWIVHPIAEIHDENIANKQEWSSDGFVMQQARATVEVPLFLPGIPLTRSLSALYIPYSKTYPWQKYWRYQVDEQSHGQGMHPENSAWWTKDLTLRRFWVGPFGGPHVHRWSKTASMRPYHRASMCSAQYRSASRARR